MIDDFTSESSYISTRKSWFKENFKKDADEYPELFLQYLSEYTNRQLRFELEEFNKNYTELKESGFFECNKGS